MHTSTLKDAAETVTGTVSDLAHTVAEMTPDVTSKVGETALRLAALTPWIDEAAKSRSSRRWIVGLAAIAALGILGWWLKNRSTDRTYADAQGGTGAAAGSERRLRAAAGS